MTLDEIRARIDEIDAQLLRLLDERLSLAVQARPLKGRIHDGDREREVLRAPHRQDLRYLSPAVGEQILRIAIEESRRVQAEVLVDDTGERGQP